MGSHQLKLLTVTALLQEKHTGKSCYIPLSPASSYNLISSLFLFTSLLAFSHSDTCTPSLLFSPITPLWPCFCLPAFPLALEFNTSKRQQQVYYQVNTSQRSPWLCLPDLPCQPPPLWGLHIAPDAHHSKTPIV